MRAFVFTVALVCLLTWTQADKHTHLKRVQMHRRARLGRTHLGTTDKERVVGRLRPGSRSAISVHSSKGAEDVQADEAVSPVRTWAGQGRRAGGPVPRRGGTGQVGLPRQAEMLQDEGTPGARARVTRMPSSSGSPNLLASFAGKNRVLVISAPHDSDGYYRLMMSLLKPDVYCELAERHVHQIVMFHQEGEMGGRVRRITTEGKVMEEPLDTALIPRLMSFLKLEKGKFGMVLLKKTLQVEERYPYPVRLEAMYEVIDQSPMRKLEKLRQKGFVQKCKAAGVEGQVEEGTLSGELFNNPSVQLNVFVLSQHNLLGLIELTSKDWTGLNLSGWASSSNWLNILCLCTQVLTNEYEDKYEPSRPTVSDPEEAETFTDVSPTKRVKGKHDKHDKKKKKTDKAAKKAERRGGKAGKEGKIGGKKNGKKLSKYPEKEDYPKPTKKPTPPPKGSLASFLDYFENRRRLLLITSPSEENSMYVQQRDEYLESVCEMAIRKVSIITIFGSLTNSTMKIDHYQIENDKPMKGLRQEDLVNQELITELRKEFSMTYDEFYMVLTDTDMRVKQSYEVPIAMKAVFDYIDTFSSRIREMEQQKRDGVVCKKEDKPRSLENFLSRFRWRRRLFIISAPSDEEWAYQQQLYALTSQACNLGLRHIAILKLVGTEAPDMGGVLELYPINGTATVEREGLSATLVKDMRNYFQVSPEYFSMLLVGKDGNVKSWYPSPMWSMAIIYDLVDSMQLRRQEMAIQQSLGMRCPEDEYGGYGYHQHGYEHGYQDGYHQGYGY
uniref:Coiled-coil domain-containing protein 80 n=1 Tax=Amphiprion ocellaris TaxID=80972 RepID=A0AAQ5XKB3_AMPOC